MILRIQIENQFKYCNQLFDLEKKFDKLVNVCWN